MTQSTLQELNDVYNEEIVSKLLPVMRNVPNNEFPLAFKKKLCRKIPRVADRLERLELIHKYNSPCKMDV